MSPWPLLAQFLPDTASDWLPFGIVLAGIVSALIRLVWKQREHDRQINAWKATGETPLATKQDVNGLGERVKVLELEFPMATGEERARIDVLERLVRDHEGEFRRTREDVAKVQSWMERCSSEQGGMKQEIIGFISERTARTDAAVNGLAIAVAVLTEQVRALREAK